MEITVIFSGKPSTVRIGAIRLDDKVGDTHKIVEIIVHPKYKAPLYYHDIALIKVGPEKVNKNFACLPPEHLIRYGDDSKIWHPSHALGYGLTSFGIFQIFWASSSLMNNV